MRRKSWQFIVKWVLRILAAVLTLASIIILILQFQEAPDLGSLNNVIGGFSAAVASLLSSFLFEGRKADRSPIDREEYLGRLQYRCDVQYVHHLSETAS